MSDVYVTCDKCIHRRRRIPLDPFSRTATWTPGLYDAKRKWTEEQRELALKEKHRYQSGDEFDYEPQFFDWCERWTVEEGRRVIDPVSGATSSLYVLCSRANKSADCKFFESAKSLAGEVK